MKDALVYRVMTAAQPGAVALVQWAGPQALEFLRAHTRARAWEPGRAVLCEWDGGLDDVLLAVLPGADGPVVQLMPHGAPAVVAAVAARLRSWGALPADDAAALYPEAAGGADALRLAWMAAAASPLALDLLAAGLGRPAAAGDPAQDPRRHLLVPARIAIVGPPNAGKSTLLNALCGAARAIASPLPGTTRDAVGARAAIPHPDFDGAEVVVQLLDTPGVRAGADALERQAAALAAGWVAEADLIIGLRAPGQAWPAGAAPRVDLWLRSHADAAGAGAADPADAAHVAYDAVSGCGLDEVRAALLRGLGLLPLPAGDWPLAAPFHRRPQPA